MQIKKAVVGKYMNNLFSGAKIILYLIPSKLNFGETILTAPARPG